MKYPVLIAAAVCCIAAAPSPQSTPTAPPSPPPLQGSPAVTVSASPEVAPSVTPTPNLDTIMGGSQPSPGPGPKGRHGAGPRGTPAPPPVRRGIDGVWEIEIQRGPKTQYEHMNLLQHGDAITGIYLTADKKRYPIAGSVDAQNNVRLVISLPDGTTILMEGLVDNLTDMRGMFTDPTERVPFTAAYRPKENWIENINASPGGLGGGTGSGPP